MEVFVSRYKPENQRSALRKKIRKVMFTNALALALQLQRGSMEALVRHVATASKFVRRRNYAHILSARWNRAL